MPRCLSFGCCWLILEVINVLVLAVDADAELVLAVDVDAELVLAVDVDDAELETVLAVLLLLSVRTVDADAACVLLPRAEELVADTACMLVLGAEELVDIDIVFVAEPPADDPEGVVASVRVAVD